MTSSPCAHSKLPAATLVALSTIGMLPSASRADPPAVPAVSPAARLLPPRDLVIPKVTLPSAEPEAATSGSAGSNPFGKALPNAQTLSPPVTVNANISADALAVTQSGAGRAINGSVTSASNALSAVKGITAGSGSGVNGVNSGTAGQAGKFEITNASSAQPSLLVTTAGSGNGVQSVIKTTANSDTPAVIGQHNATSGWGIGVEGDGAYIGVKGLGGNYGVLATGNTYGVYSSSYSGYGVYASSSQAIAVYGSGGSGDDGEGGHFVAGHVGVSGESTNTGVIGKSTGTGIGVLGQSKTGFGVFGFSDSSYAVYGSSTSSYSGYFTGTVYAGGAITAASYGYTSDRDQKQDFASIDTADLLDKIAALPVTAWDYKAKPAERHIGPMAQDFRAAFGLGADDKHIDVVDGIGVSLAAIQELQRQLTQKEARIDAMDAQARQKDARIVALESQVEAMQSSVGARLAALEQATAAIASSTARP